MSGESKRLWQCTAAAGRLDGLRAENSLSMYISLYIYTHDIYIYRRTHELLHVKWKKEKTFPFSYPSCPTAQQNKTPSAVNKIVPVRRNGKCWKTLTAGFRCRDAFRFCQLPACLKEVASVGQSSENTSLARRASSVCCSRGSSLCIIALGFVWFSTFCFLFLGNYWFSGGK